jgi:hypothetical protein
MSLAGIRDWAVLGKSQMLGMPEVQPMAMEEEPRTFVTIGYPDFHYESVEPTA